ncbi:MAG: haloacid dehalogenase, partial [Anaerovibrio sp.]|nr:haloacid dehalogenase [Anaerovibrio sp.]
MDSFEDKVQKLKDVRVFLLDMDGTIFLGEKLLPRAKEFLDYLRSSGRRFIFLTN